MTDFELWKLTTPDGRTHYTTVPDPTEPFLCGLTVGPSKTMTVGLPQIDCPECREQVEQLEHNNG